MKKTATELPIIQKTYDLIIWYVPHLNRLPRDHKFTLGNRLIEGLYACGARGDGWAAIRFNSSVGK